MELAEGFSPLLFIALVWFIIYRVIAAAKKTARTQETNAARQRAEQKKLQQRAEREALLNQEAQTAQMVQTAQTAPASQTAPAFQTAPARVETPAQQSYQGSMNADSLEGIDPCHDEQMHAMDALREESGNPAPAESGLNLSWTSQDVVRGFICSEVLNRKRKSA